MVLEIFLFVCVSGAQAGTPNFLCKRHPMPSMEICEKASNTFKASTDQSIGKGNTVFIYCGGKDRWAHIGN